MCNSSSAAATSDGSRKGFFGGLFGKKTKDDKGKKPIEVGCTHSDVVFMLRYLLVTRFLFLTATTITSHCSLSFVVTVKFTDRTVEAKRS